jgi:hypothetical protein
MSLAQEIITDHQTYRATNIEIEFCQFLKIQPGGGSGGAFESSAPVKLFNTLFEECQALEGGAIGCTNSLSMDLISIRSCIARASGALFIRGEWASANFTRCHFFNERAELFGVLFRFSKSDFTITSCNFTHCRAERCCGCLETKFGPMELKFSVVCESSAVTHNGAICTRQLDELTYEFCQFANISHCSDEVESAAVLLCYENAYHSAIVNCTFLGNEPNASWTIKVLGGHLLVISGCYFTGKIERELGPGLMKSIGCEFERVISRYSISGDRKLGFDGELTAMPVLRTREEFGDVVKAKKTKMKTKTAGRIVICVCFSLISATLLTFIGMSVNKGFAVIGKNAKSML